MMFKFNPALLLFLTLMSNSPGVVAQAVTVISNGGDARSCSMAADSAAKSVFISREDLDYCSRAIDYGRLKQGDLAGTFVNRGIIEAALALYQDAFADYQRAMEVKPELPEAYVGRGNIYFLAEKYDRAIDDYTRALDLNISRDYIAHFNLGMVYEKTGKFENAEENYRRALELRPDWQLAKDKLARLLVKENKRDMGNRK